ncbi:MAG: TetR/AcrR family transcriptional regulator [Planctomycetota bacterium]
MAGRPRQFDEEHALQAAMQVFWSRGYEAVGVRELLGEMGMCRQSFYDTFGDKRGLFLRAVRRYADEAVSGLQQRLDGPGRAIDQLRSLLSEKAKKATGADCRGCLAVNTMVEWGDADDEVEAVVRGMIKRLAKLTADAVRRAQHDGDVPSDADPNAIADVILFTVLGFGALSRLRIPRSMAQHVLDAVLPDPKTA